MKVKTSMWIPAVALTLWLAGCTTTPEMADEGMEEDGAPVTAPESGMGPSGGAATMGATEGGAWTGNPLDDPDSPLYGKTIYFEYDSSEVRSDYLEMVAAHGQYLAANPSAVVTVEGHCDERGSREYNIGLGERRANAVRRLLLAQGATGDQIVTVSYGEERPADPGTGEYAWSQNRRAQLLY